MPVKERKKKVASTSADTSVAPPPPKPMMVVRANCNASDEASVVVDVGKDSERESGSTVDVSVDAGQKNSQLDENVVMKLSFGTGAVGAFDAPVAGVLSGSGLYSSIGSIGSEVPISDFNCTHDPWSMPSATPACWSDVNNINGINGINNGQTLMEPTFNSITPAATSKVPVPSTLTNSTHSMHSTHPMAKVVRLLAEFEEKGKTGEWPLSTSVHCYWCSHRFDSPPVGLPIKFMPSAVGGSGKFQTIGCFCSLQCACAYNFDSNRDSEDECMTRYGLLNALSAKLGCGRIVKPAPSRLSLSMYGGHMSIDEFRSYGSHLSEGVQRQIIINCPPMQSLTQQVEDVAETDMMSEYRYVPLDNDRVQRYQEKVRLQRTKPLSDMKNTLDRTMKLKYSTAAN